MTDDIQHYIEVLFYLFFTYEFRSFFVQTKNVQLSTTFLCVLLCSYSSKEG